MKKLFFITLLFFSTVLFADGELDSSFGIGGKVIIDFGGTDIARAALLQPDGKIIAVGDDGTDFALARYNTDGSLDTSFGPNNDGKVTTDFGGTDQAFAALLQPDGKIIAVGEARAGSTNFALARYNPDGSLDTSFGTNGLVTTDFGGALDQANAALLQPDGEIIAVGRSNAGATTDFTLARYLIDSIEVSPLAEDLRAKYTLLQQLQR